MRDFRLSPKFCRANLKLRGVDDELVSIQRRFRRRIQKLNPLPTFGHGGIAWHCEFLAGSTLLRAEELLKSALWALDSGAMISAIVAHRAYQETAGFVSLAKREIEAAIDTRDSDKLRDTMGRLLVGSVFSRRLGITEAKEPFSARELMLALNAHYESVFREFPSDAMRRHYSELSDVAHPSSGSTWIYWRRRGRREYLSRTGRYATLRPEDLVLDLRMMSFVVLSQADALCKLGGLDVSKFWADKPSSDREIDPGTATTPSTEVT